MTTSCMPLRILSFDGGGIRGISSLLILEDIMEKIRDAKGLDRVPRPCEYFDFIGGTSTGGIIAIMLGRLGMSVDECIRAYKKVAQQAFTPKKMRFIPASPSGAFSAKALEGAIRQTVRDFCVQPECATRPAQDLTMSKACSHSEMAFRDDSCIKTAILAITKDNIDARPTLFTTYDTSTALNGCTIWEVARATSAATTFFKPISVGRDGIEFIDAGFGYNNPCEILIEEAQRQFPGRGLMRVLSIGTGLGDVVEIGNTRMSIIAALKKMATCSKKVAARLDDRYGENGQYCRFNVDQGLQDITLSDWEKASTISAHTRNYLTSNQRTIKKFVDNFIKAIHEGEDGESSQTVAKATELSPMQNDADSVAGPWCHIPFQRNIRFVGRERTLSTIMDKLFIQGTKKVALFGLGGVGKTQVALELAFRTKENKADCSVFWVPALSEATFEQAYTDIARKLEIRCGDNQDVKQSVQQYLSSEAAGRWLLVVDNADDRDVLFESFTGITEYLPESKKGLTLFTTRSREMAVNLAECNIVELQEMDGKGAASLFRASVIQNERIEDTALTELLNELTNLPLAIVQAAAYLNKNQASVPRYLSLLRGAEREIVSLISREFRDSTRYAGSQNSVAATWLVSFEQIRRFDRVAADLLSFISCIEPKAIPQSILPHPETEEEMTHAIGTLCGYAFLSRRGESDMFDMHSLVHTATKVWIKNQGDVKETEIGAVQHLAAIFPSAYPVNQGLWRGYLPHTLRIFHRRTDYEIEEKYNLGYLAGQCLDVDRRFKEAVSVFECVVAVRKRTLAEEDHSRLASEHALASAYLKDRQIEKAIEIFEHVVAVQKRTLAVKDHSRLTSEHELASAYLEDRQIEKAIEIFEHVVAVQKRTLAEEDHSRLTSEHALASAYRALGQTTKLATLLEHTVI
ncbi:kinase subdomain-containing protein [Triangularia setosa]|uniref:Kinase subdomain-containing protein n=1 Tax=Triangularia setosa TaxID=2587417 RepID=A0AAN6W3V9_9PEZI|nr:kinase subdomain-containing protein [Podospora setosa]